MVEMEIDRWFESGEVGLQYHEYALKEVDGEVIRRCPARIRRDCACDGESREIKGAGLQGQS